MDKNVALTLFYIVYDAQARRGKGSPSSLTLLLFVIILNSEDQNNEFDNPEQKRRTVWLKIPTNFSGALHLLHHYKSNLDHLLVF